MSSQQQQHSATLGVFDSGIGGLSVVREIMRLSGDCRLLYLADTAHHPYGPKEPQDVLNYCKLITEFFLRQQVDAIVIACNTASAAALHPLRELYPQATFVGMEPAVKPAAQKTVTGKVGVLATQGTFCGKPYAGVRERFTQGIEVFEQPCAGLAEMIEKQAAEDDIRTLLQGWIEPMRSAGVDQIALACTHYPLIIELIREIAGDTIEVIDPSVAVAKQALKVCGVQHFENRDVYANNCIELYSTSATSGLSAALCHYCSVDVPVEHVELVSEQFQDVAGKGNN